MEKTLALATIAFLLLLGIGCIEKEPEPAEPFIEPEEPLPQATEPLEEDGKALEKEPETRPPEQVFPKIDLIEITSCEKNRIERPNVTAVVKASGIEFLRKGQNPLVPVYGIKKQGQRTITLTIEDLYSDNQLNPEYPIKECGPSDERVVKKVERIITVIELSGKKVLFEGKETLDLAPEDSSISVGLPENLEERFVEALIEVKVKGTKTLTEENCILGIEEERESALEFNCAFYVDETQ